ncbi:uncharacterized protein LOC133527688 [Cydia pomonella]|uniref:uncharacterized protein LOC133527688 n=1 Tax=Cydia pomonella TaxID=82600 RepID=UPI002ADD504C|nr:uncharacterized protein LOC133527688 [Cydia pomonella]
MARKGQVAIQDSVETDEEFENYLNANFNRLICMEVYSDFCGPCLATAFAVRKGKMEIGQDRIAMVKAMSDNIDALSRFKNKSEPVFLFISKGKLTRALFGANGIELCRIIEEELALTQKEIDTGAARPKHEISEQLPEETARLEDELKLETQMKAEEERIRIATLAARKKRVSERLSYAVASLNFILFFPHCHQAYYDLYENWDVLAIQVAAKEEIQITEDMIPEVLYMSDVEPNEACVHALCHGPALVVLFKFFDNDFRNFVQVLRHFLYEMIPEPKEDVPPEKQIPPIPAYERYATISKTPREVRRDRYNAMLQKQREEEEERMRLEAEQARLAREAEEERLAQEKQRLEEEKMARIAAGLPASPEPEPATEEEQLPEGEEGERPEGELPEGEKAEQTEDTEGAPTEEAPPEEVVEEFHSDVEVEGEEYIPPGGLFVPGFYSPPNNLAKANGLKLFFPKVVASMTKIESEHLPPHTLVMFPADKREGVKEIVDQYPDEILNLGIFHGDELHSLEHVAYTIKQYDKMERGYPHKSKDRVAVMVSRKRSLPLLQLAGLNPTYISIDPPTAVRDCLTLFPVGYGDEYEEEESVVEEEIVEVPPESEPVAEGQPVEKKEGGEDEDEEED